MAYNPDNLSALVYANGFTLWHYKTTDLAATIDTTGYFNAAPRMLRAGDRIFVNAAGAATDVVVAGNDRAGVRVKKTSLWVPTAPDVQEVGKA
jgi:hypothetical protein